MPDGGAGSTLRCARVSAISRFLSRPTLWGKNRNVLVTRVVLPGSWRGSWANRQVARGSSHLVKGHLPVTLSAGPCLPPSSLHDTFSDTFLQPASCFLGAGLALPDGCVDHSGTHACPHAGHRAQGESYFPPRPLPWCEAPSLLLSFHLPLNVLQGFSLNKLERCCPSKT